LVLALINGFYLASLGRGCVHLPLRCRFIGHNYLMGLEMGNRTKAQLKKHYEDYQGTPEQIKKRAQRNAARASMVEKHGKSALSGKDVHHKTPIRSGGGNSSGNLAISSVAKNRGWESEKKKKR
jgi:hypothetical protein